MWQRARVGGQKSQSGTVVHGENGGRPEPAWAEVVLPYVGTRIAGPQANAADLDAHCLQQLACFKPPMHYCFVPEPPKNHYPKNGS